MKNEERLLVASLQMFRDGHTRLHGYGLNKFIAANGDPPFVVSTLYRCLDRLEALGFVDTTWEQDSETDRWRKSYTLTGAGIEMATNLAGSDSGSAQLRTIYRDAGPLAV